MIIFLFYQKLIASDKTFAEMDDDFRSKMNHRAKALEKFKEFLKNI